MVLVRNPDVLTHELTDYSTVVMVRHSRQESWDLSRHPW